MKRWLFLVLVVACSTKHSGDDDDDGGSGGESAGIGGSPAGGKGGKGGASGASSAKGGSGASTGKGGSSGASNLGGAQASGGDTSAAGEMPMGAGDGGMPSGGEPGGSDGGTGGTNGGTGGTNGGTGGTGSSMSGTGGSAGQSSATCDTEFSVGNDGFVRMLAHDACWHGYAMSGGDSLSSVYPKTWETCGTGCQLSIIGTVSGSSGGSYAYLGFSLNQPAGGDTKGKVTPTGTGIKLTHTYTSTLSAYLELVSDSTAYCVSLPASGTTVPYSSFKTNCWDVGSGNYYAKQPIDSIEVSISGALDATDFNLHIVSVEEL